MFVIRFSQAWYLEFHNLINRFDRRSQQGGPAMQNMIDFILEMGEDYASQVTHQWTATLFRSYLTEQRGNIGAIYVDPGAKNPYGQRPAEYAAYEFARGGSHDAFTMTQFYIEEAVLPRAAGIFVSDAFGGSEIGAAVRGLF